jgi:hypothetical protein
MTALVISEYKQFMMDLKAHLCFEEEAARRVQNYFHLKEIPLLNGDVKNFKYYDFTDENGKTYEVKTDRRSRDTGNYFVEVMNRCKPSGLSISKSNYYVITDTREYMMIETNVLKVYIETQKPRQITINGSVGYLVNVIDLKKYMIEI